MISVLFRLGLNDLIRLIVLLRLFLYDNIIFRIEFERFFGTGGMIFFTWNHHDTGFKLNIIYYRLLTNLVLFAKSFCCIKLFLRRNENTDVFLVLVLKFSEIKFL